MGLLLAQVHLLRRFSITDEGMFKAGATRDPSMERVFPAEPDTPWVEVPTAAAAKRDQANPGKSPSFPDGLCFSRGFFGAGVLTEPPPPDYLSCGRC
jgi:hypothetical protein